ncbi:MAG: Hsp20/alpha crystallin family protein [Cyanobacteria bacterium P01_A01_bin.114]
MSTLIRWNPWQEVSTLERQLNRLFEDTLAPMSASEFGNFAKVPAAELNETDEALYLKLELPGIKAEDLDIEVTERAVAIRGERKSEQTAEENGAARSEFYYGKFERVIPLSARVENTEVTADYRDGILNLVLPKTAQERNKVVKVDVRG